MLTHDRENIPQVIGLYASHAPQIRDPGASNWPLDLGDFGKDSVMTPEAVGAVAEMGDCCLYLQFLLDLAGRRTRFLREHFCCLV